MKNEKKIKLNNLYIVRLGYVKNRYGDCDLLKDVIVFAHAKHHLLSKTKIKYFINAIDKTKYLPREKRKMGLGVAYALPISSVMDIVGPNHKIELFKNKYMSYDDAINIMETYKKNKCDDLQKIESNNIFENNNNENLHPKCGVILTDKFFASRPAIGREEEIQNLIISLAQKKKNPIIVGPSGIGKTTLVDELAFLIINGSVPNFLKYRKIIEINAAELVSGTIYRGTLESKVMELINYIKRTHAILFIDEIHTIYGAGKSVDSNNDIAAMIKHAIDRDGIKVIGTTTSEEYNKYFATDALKRRFERIDIEEPKNKTLHEIINYTFDSYSTTTGIFINHLDRRIVDILIELTNEKHRRYDDKVCNPDLVAAIIDKAFGRAIARNSSSLGIDDIINAITSNNRIYDTAKKKAIREIRDLYTEKKTEKKAKILRLK